MRAHVKLQLLKPLGKVEFGWVAKVEWQKEERKK